MVADAPSLENQPKPAQRGVSPGGAGGGLRRGSGLGDAAEAAPAVLVAGMDTRGGGAADCLLQADAFIRVQATSPRTQNLTSSVHAAGTGPSSQASTESHGAKLVGLSWTTQPSSAATASSTKYFISLGTSPIPAFTDEQKRVANWVGLQESCRTCQSRRWRRCAWEVRRCRCPWRACSLPRCQCSHTPPSCCRSPRPGHWGLLQSRPAVSQSHTCT